MANYQLLKADIDAKVYENAQQKITGEILNSVLKAMVATLGAEYQFAGVATIDTNPGTPDAKVFYFANGKGTYTNFSSLEVTEDDVVVLYWDSAWHKEATGIASQAKLTELESETDTRLVELEKKTGADSVALEVDYVAGGAYDSSGNLSISSGKYTNEIDINNIDSIKFNGVIGSSARYCLFYTGSVLAYAVSEAAIVDGSVVDTSKYDKMKLSFSANADVRITAKYKDLSQEVDKIKKSVYIDGVELYENIEIETKTTPTFVDGYWNTSGTTPSQASGYFCIKELASVKIGDKVKLYNWTLNSNGAAAYLYDSQKNAIGARINGSAFVNKGDYLEYDITNINAAYIGINHFGSNYNSAFFSIVKETAQINSQLLLNYQKVEAAKPIDLFMFMGQSNMAGRGITTQEHPEKYPNIISGAGYEFKAISDPSKLYPCAEPFGRLENVSGAINDYTQKTGSMVTSFVNAYFAKTKIPIVGVSASEGGTRITQWQPNGARLNDAISRLMSAIKWLTDNGYIIRHKYMAWCQGESDGDNAMSGDDYVSAFLQMFNAMKSAGIEKCFLVRIGKYNGTASRDYTVISNAQTQLCKTNEDVILVSTAFASFKEKGLMKDDWHYVQEAYNKVGANAGSNAAEFVIGRKEPIMYDSMTNDLYFSEYSY